MINYIKNRFPLLRYVSLSILLSLFVVDLGIPYATASWLAIIIFLFLTLFVFRMLDDAGSWYFDRQDTERTYAQKEHLKLFLIIAGIAALAYFLLFIGLFDYAYGWHVVALYIVTALLYLVLGKKKWLVYALPFVKYIVIFWALSSENLSLAIGVMLIFVIYDILETGARFPLSVSLTVVSGILIFGPVPDILGVIVIGVAGLLTVAFKNKYFLFIYYPVAFLLLRIFFND